MTDELQRAVTKEVQVGELLAALENVERLSKISGISLVLAWGAISETRKKHEGLKARVTELQQRSAADA